MTHRTTEQKSESTNETGWRPMALLGVLLVALITSGCVTLNQPVYRCEGYSTVCHFDATDTVTDDGEGNWTYMWDFDDGSTAQGLVVTHSFGAVGEYAVSFTGSDAQGLEVRHLDMTILCFHPEGPPPDYERGPLECQA